MKLTILHGDVFQRIKDVPSESIDLVITSPPFWGLRDYGIENQLGNEPTMEAHLDNTMRWVKEVWRVLKPTGSFVLDIGDTFSNPEKGNYQSENGIVCDPFLGSGTTMRVAMETQRSCVGIELNEKYIEYAKKRLNWGQGLNVEYAEAI